MACLGMSCVGVGPVYSAAAVSGSLLILGASMEHRREGKSPASGLGWCWHVPWNTS